MAKSFVKINYAGVGELLRSPEMDNVLKGYADAVVNNAGEGFVSHRYEGKRIAYTITPDSVQASNKNKKENTLVKALGAARR